MQARVYLSASTNPYENLAYEEALLMRGDDEISLLTYQNQDCVIVGRNQDVWQECCPQTLARDNICLLRRVTGGGAVYHDCGNLNFAYLFPKQAIPVHQPLQWVMQALQKIGIKAAENPHHALFIKNQKFSGTASCIKKDRVLFHGTLLVSSNLDRLQSSLTGGTSTNPKAVKSNPSDVVNLSTVCPGVSIAQIQKLLQDDFNERFECKPQIFVQNALSQDEIFPYLTKQQSESWIYHGRPT